MKMTGMLSFLALIVIAFSACQKEDVLNNLTNSIDLSDDQKMDLVSSALASSTGGIMAQLELSGNFLDSTFYAFGKLDTSLTYNWMHYDVELSFFAGGIEVPLYIPGLVDSVTADIHLTGDTTYASQTGGNGTWTLNLNTHAMLYLKQLALDTIRVNGNGADSSLFVNQTQAQTLNIESRSTFALQNVVMPIGGPTYYPVAGTVSGVVAGTASNGTLTKNIQIPYTATFTGDGRVTVTLTNSGLQFVIDLTTGQIIR